VRNYRVELERRAKKDLLKCPLHVRRKLLDWVEDVEDRGLEEVRKIKGYHDEALHGERKNQRSIRLSRSYRAFYTEEGNNLILVRIIEVNKHDY